MTDFRQVPDAVAVRAGWKMGEIRCKMFRHSYCAARLQTLDRSAPVSRHTVARELGQGGDAMVKRVYGHLGHVHHRAKVVESRVSQDKKVLGKRLAAVRRAPRLIPGLLPPESLYCNFTRQAGFEPTTFGSGGCTGQRTRTLAGVVSGIYGPRPPAGASHHRPRWHHRWHHGSWPRAPRGTCVDSSL